MSCNLDESEQETQNECSQAKSRTRLYQGPIKLTAKPSWVDEMNAVAVLDKLRNCPAMRVHPSWRVEVWTDSPLASEENPSHSNNHQRDSENVT